MSKAKKILIIEDDALLGRLLAKRLKEEELDFSLVITGEEGLEKARTEKPDLILLDLVLPGIDGYEVLRQLKDNKELAGIPVVIISNLGQKAEIERGLQLGAEDFIVKANFDLDQIMEKIKPFLV